MPELENKEVKHESAGDSVGGTSGRDTISSLHKMSTTAGLGSQDYVAINGACVGAILLGLASGIAYFHNILLVVPLTAVVLGVIGIRQVNRSSGTQTGKGLAAVGMVLAAAFSLVLIGMQIRTAMTERAHRDQVTALLDQFGEHLQAERWEEAHALFSGRFQERVPLTQFTRQLQPLRSHPVNGAVTRFEWNRGRVELLPGLRQARAMAIIEYERTDIPARHEFFFLRTGDQWQIDDYPDIFSRQVVR